MKLIETYANSAGVKIPTIPLLPYTSFYPLPFKKYITFHPSSGMPAKNYDYYSEVLIDILPILREHGIEVVQIGSPEDRYFDGCYDLRGKTSISQGCFIVKNASLHLGNDSVWMHVAGLFQVPVVALFGPTYAAVCGPHYLGESILLDSHRNGERASHNPKEEPKTINLIMPEEVCNSVLSLLKVKERVNKKTVFIGSEYCNFKINYIPSNPFLHQEFKDCVFDLRTDICYNPEVIGNFLNNVRCNVHICQPHTFDFSLLNNRKNIVSVIYHAESCGAINLQVVKHLAANFNYNVLFLGEDYDDAKLKLLDYNISRKENLEKPKNLNKEYLFKSTELFYSDGKTYLSKWHYDRGIYQNSIENNIGTIPQTDDTSFWNSRNNFLVYENL